MSFRSWIAAHVGLALALAGGLPVAASAASEGASADAPGTEQVLKPPRKTDGEGPPRFTTEFLSPVYTVDQIYPSMKGPVSTHELIPDPDAPGELVWMTGFESTMVNESASDEISDEFMCHTNLSFAQPQRDLHHRRFPSQIQLHTGRLFTLSQGQLEVRFPDGFGVPLIANQPLLVNTQVLNHNLKDDTIQVRHRVELEFIRDRDLEKPLEALLPMAVQGMALVEGEDGHFGLSSEEIDPETHGEGCDLGLPAHEDPQEVFPDGRGRVFTGFWVVPPGRDERTTRVTQQLKLPYDTRAHFIAVHVHPYAKSLELYDRSAGKTVFKSFPRSRTDQVGLAVVETYSSQEGIPLYKGHEYDLISIYDNTSKVDADAMATMLLYVAVKDLYDFDFRPRKKSTASTR